MIDVEKFDTENLINSPSNWKGCDIRSSQVWHTYITPKQIEEIRIAAISTVNQGLEIAEITQTNFPLPTFGFELKRIYDDVVHGRGFAMLHNMPVADLSREEAIRAYVGVGSWLGEPVSQNRKGHIIGHVKDIGLDPTNKQNRIYGTSARQPYHTDSADIVSLLCLKPCKSGGIFSLSSTTAIYNEMVRVRPDLVAVLEQPFVFDRKGEIPEGKQATYEMPLFHRYKGRLLAIHDRNFIDAALERPDVAPLTEIQIEALDMFDEIAAREDFYVDLEWKTGDMAFVHNHTNVHARTDYEDFEELEQRRHNLRLWLSTKHGFELPPVFEERYGPIEPGKKRGGIMVPGMKLTCPLEAE